MEWSRDGYVLTDDTARADVDAIHTLLRDTYGARERSSEQIEATLRQSRCFSLLWRGVQVGLFRALSDRAAYTYLMDCVLAPEHQERGLGTWAVRIILAYPEFAGTRFILVTRDAQPFYRKLGFVTHPYECMLHGPRPG